MRDVIYIVLPVEKEIEINCQHINIFPYLNLIFVFFLKIFDLMIQLLGEKNNKH